MCASIRRRITTLTAKANGITSAMRLPSRPPRSTASMNISTMPQNAATIVSQVRPGTCSCRNSLPSSAAENGVTLAITRTLATVVRPSARMKQMYMSAHSAPAMKPGTPTARMRWNIPPRYCTASTPRMNRVMNSDRQKVISQLSRRSMLRTSMPAVDQHSVAPTMSSTPRR